MSEATERVLVACPTYEGKRYALTPYLQAFEDFAYPYKGLFLVDNTGMGLDYFEELKGLHIPCDHIQPNNNFQETFARSWKRILREALDKKYEWVCSIEQDNICPPLTLDILLNIAGYLRAVHVSHSYPWHSFQQDEGVIIGLGCNLILTDLLKRIFDQEQWHTDAFESELYDYPHRHRLTSVEVHRLIDIRHLDGKEGEEYYAFPRETIPKFTEGNTGVRLPKEQEMNHNHQIADEFHKLWYFSDRTWNNGDTKWRGVPVLQNPLDMWVIQEILHETQPDLVIETGSCVGGSALFYTSCSDACVVSIDLQTENVPIVSDPRIEFIKGSSTDRELVSGLSNRINGQKVMVILDSDHATEHVAKELELYAPLVTPGCYLVACDTNLGGHPIQNAAVSGPGPMAAVLDFLSHHPEFEPDRSREKYLMTFFPNGWLRKIA